MLCIRCVDCCLFMLLLIFIFYYIVFDVRVIVICLCWLRDLLYVLFLFNCIVLLCWFYYNFVIWDVWGVGAYCIWIACGVYVMWYVMLLCVYASPLYAMLVLCYCLCYVMWCCVGVVCACCVIYNVITFDFIWGAYLLYLYCAVFR